MINQDSKIISLNNSNKNSIEPVLLIDNYNAENDTGDLIKDITIAGGVIAGSVTSAAIGEETLKQLYLIDAVAYVRFASVYRSFNNLDQFIEEVEALAKEAKKE